MWTVEHAYRLKYRAGNKRERWTGVNKSFSLLEIFICFLIHSSSARKFQKCQNQPIARCIATEYSTDITEKGWRRNWRKNKEQSVKQWRGNELQQPKPAGKAAWPIRPGGWLGWPFFCRQGTTHLSLTCCKTTRTKETEPTNLMDMEMESIYGGRIPSLFKKTSP